MATRSEEGGISQTLHKNITHTYPMRRFGKAHGALALVILSASLTSPSPATADAIAAPSPSPSIESFKGSIEQYKIAKEAFIEAVKIRNQQIREINLEFKIAIEKSTQDFRNAMALAKNPDQKTIIASARKSAVSAAIIARDAAIEALGEEPVPPIEPSKFKKAPTKSKNR